MCFIFTQVSNSFLKAYLVFVIALLWVSPPSKGCLSLACWIHLYELFNVGDCFLPGDGSFPNGIHGREVLLTWYTDISLLLGPLCSVGFCECIFLTHSCYLTQLFSKAWNWGIGYLPLYSSSDKLFKFHINFTSLKIVYDKCNSFSSLLSPLSPSFFSYLPLSLPPSFFFLVVKTG